MNTATTYGVRNEHGEIEIIGTSLHEAWDTRDAYTRRRAREAAAYTVVEITTMDRPVLPRPCMEIDGQKMYYRHGALYTEYDQYIWTAESILAAATLWAEHQEWLASPGNV
jgi:hypothetical protein